MLRFYNDSRIVIMLNKDTDIYDRYKYPYKYPYTGMNIPILGLGRVEIKTNRFTAQSYLSIFRDGVGKIP